MSVSKPDSIDKVQNYFVNMQPANLFKSLHLLIGEWPKYLSSVNSRIISNSAKAFGNVINAFDLVDFFENVNILRNRLLNKTTDAITIAAADVYYEAHFALEFLINSNIATVAATTMQNSSIIAGITLAYSFGAKSIENLTEYQKEVNETKKNIALAKLVKTVALCAMGVLLAYSSIYSTIIPAPYMLILSTSALVSSLAKGYFEYK
ncbi:MAG: hypothetical protein K1060chlam5_00016 [Candidatus Anoxychlamydiales bacterium]|nr:hypothetical protein [Candidatus Anoxychlamydiales bacterium]